MTAGTLLPRSSPLIAAPEYRSVTLVVVVVVGGTLTPFMFTTTQKSTAPRGSEKYRHANRTMNEVTASCLNIYKQAITHSRRSHSPAAARGSDYLLAYYYSWLASFFCV